MSGADDDSEPISAAFDDFALVAHEIRAPLGTLVGYLTILDDLLAEENVDPAVLRHSARAARLRAEELSGLCADLIDAVRVRQGSGATDIVDLGELARAVVAELPTAGGPRVMLDLGPAPATVRGHKRFLERVVFNLLDNALKYSPQESPVQLRLTLDDGYVVLEVHDLGDGLRSGGLSHAFARFDRLGAQNGIVPGTGIGLHFCQRVVREHGGEIAIAAREGRGSTVVVRLPAVSTVYTAAGGAEGMVRLAHAWHARVLADEVVSHAFSHGYHPDHTQRLAAYWGEALGGPGTYSAEYGDESSVVRMHSGNGAHEEMDRRAIACFDVALTDAGIDDERLRGVLHDYFAWTTTTTMAAYEDSADDVPDGLGLPQWSWGGLVSGEDGESA